ncbi:MAG: sigma-70 family RNA polymerase sigma factor [Bacteroidota bacterium]
MFREYYPILFAQGLRLSANAPLTRDQLQLFFLELWEAGFELRQVGHPKAYLLKSFQRKMIKALKAERQRKQMPDSYELPPQHSYETLLIEAQEQENQRHRLRNTLEALPEVQRKMLKLRFHEGMSYDEIAATTGKSRQTIYNQIHSAVSRLRKLLSR